MHKRNLLKILKEVLNQIIDESLLDINDTMGTKLKIILPLRKRLQKRETHW